jgi:hypothetical protein
LVPVKASLRVTDKYVDICFCSVYCRVEFIPFFFCVSSLSGSIATQGKENPIVALASLNGAYAVEKWKEGCTHVVVEEGSPVTEMVLAAVASSKPVVQTDWWQVVLTSFGILFSSLLFCCGLFFTDSTVFSTMCTSSTATCL